MAVASRTDIVKLYRELLKTGKGFSSYNFRYSYTSSVGIWCFLSLVDILSLVIDIFEFQTLSYHTRRTRHVT